MSTGPNIVTSPLLLTKTNPAAGCNKLIRERRRNTFDTKYAKDRRTNFVFVSLRSSHFPLDATFIFWVLTPTDVGSDSTSFSDTSDGVSTGLL
jgi:hypothetical protein